MVDYIYTGSTDLVEGYAEDVLAIADKYAILPLKEQCERYLSTTINCKNVASTAVFADTYSASILKQVRIHIYYYFNSSFRFVFNNVLKVVWNAINTNYYTVKEFSFVVASLTSINAIIKTSSVILYKNYL